MEDARARAREAVEALAEYAGERLSESDWTLLTRRAEVASDIPHSDKPRYAELGEMMHRGFFIAAVRGHEFVPREVVQAERGQTIAANYPEASTEFLRFANSFWTLKYLADEMRAEDPYLALTSMLTGVDRQLGPIFFPVPGPVRISPARREADQRRILEALARGLDIDSFMKGNPILRRDRVAGGSGCLGAVALVGASVTTLVRWLT